MWLAYRNYPEIVDLRTGVEHLYEKFSDLAFDADHEAVYGEGKFASEEDCFLYRDRYLNAKELCDKFLKSEITIEQLYNGLKEVGMFIYLSLLRPYLPKEIFNKEDEEKDDKGEVEEEEEIMEVDEEGWDEVDLITNDVEC